VARRTQAVLNAQLPTADIKVVASGWLTLFAGEAVGELAAVVSKQLDDLHRRRAFQPV